MLLACLHLCRLTRLLPSCWSFSHLMILCLLLHVSVSLTSNKVSKYVWILLFFHTKSIFSRKPLVLPWVLAFLLSLLIFTWNTLNTQLSLRFILLPTFGWGMWMTRFVLSTRNTFLDSTLTLILFALTFSLLWKTNTIFLFLFLTFWYAVMSAKRTTPQTHHSLQPFTKNPSTRTDTSTTLDIIPNTRSSLWQRHYSTALKHTSLILMKTKKAVSYETYVLLCDLTDFLPELLFSLAKTNAPKLTNLNSNNSLLFRMCKVHQKELDEFWTRQESVLPWDLWKPFATFCPLLKIRTPQKIRVVLFTTFLALTVTMFILVKPNVALSHDWPIIGEPQASWDRNFLHFANMRWTLTIPLIGRNRKSWKWRTIILNDSSRKLGSSMPILRLWTGLLATVSQMFTVHWLNDFNAI